MFDQLTAEQREQLLSALSRDCYFWKEGGTDDDRDMFNAIRSIQDHLEGVPGFLAGVPPERYDPRNKEEWG